MSYLDWKRFLGRNIFSFTKKISLDQAGKIFLNEDIFSLIYFKKEKLHMAFLIKNLFLNTRKILKVAKISNQDFHFFCSMVSSVLISSTLTDWNELFLRLLDLKVRSTQMGLLFVTKIKQTWIMTGVELGKLKQKIKWLSSSLPHMKPYEKK